MITENSLKNLTYSFPKGHIPWNKGTKGVMKENSGSFKKGRKDAVHPEWKGENASYSAKHHWITRWRGRPKKCEDCGNTKAKTYDWANISREYKRELSDWKRLCRSCHHKFDNISEKLWKTRNQQSV